MPTIPGPTIRRLQDQLAELLGAAPESRASMVAGMLRRNATEATAYWLQLVVSIGIATLGLVLGSTAAVIGAMLVAPLMGPIVGLAMGLAAGSPFLVLRSAGRVAFSVVLAVAGAAVITLMLPFHQLNAEISARTSPTALDLLTAAFCALAGVYATLRPGSDTTTAAAGTSISISLIPPLCASGYGLGTGTWSVASGAALLFLTNLVAIVVVGTVSFLLAGFNRVDVVSLEHDELPLTREAPLSRAAARRLAALFGSRSGPWLRFLMPFVLLTVVYVPLRRALNEVAWEVRVRARVQESINRIDRPVVQSRVRIERHHVDLAVVLLGKSEDAAAVRERLDADVRTVAGIAPHVEVLAIPDSTAFAGLESTLLKPAVASVATETPADKLRAARMLVRGAVEKYWPADAAGPILALDLRAQDMPMLIHIVHQGSELARSAQLVLERSISAEIGLSVRLRTSAIPLEPLVRGDDDYRFVSDLSAALHTASIVDGLSICVLRAPEPPAWRPWGVKDRTFAGSVLALLSRTSGVRIAYGAEWQVRFATGQCAFGTDGGGGDAAPADGANSTPPEGGISR